MGGLHRPKCVPCPTSTSQHQLVPRAPLFTRAPGVGEGGRCLGTPAVTKGLYAWTLGLGCCVLHCSSIYRTQHSLHSEGHFQGSLATGGQGWPAGRPPPPRVLDLPARGAQQDEWPPPQASSEPRLATPLQHLARCQRFGRELGTTGILFSGENLTRKNVEGWLSG